MDKSSRAVILNICLKNYFQNTYPQNTILSNNYASFLNQFIQQMNDSYVIFTVQFRKLLSLNYLIRPFTKVETRRSARLVLKISLIWNWIWFLD